MTLNDLISLAAAEAGSLGKMAEGMGRHQNRITEWKKGAAKPDAHEIAYMATLANLPVLETVAELEAQMDDRYAHIWRGALGKLRASGVVACTSFLIVGLMGTPEKAFADKHLEAHQAGGILYIVVS